MTKNEIKALITSGEIYDPSDADLMTYQLSRIEQVNRFNRTPATPEGLKERSAILATLFEAIGEGCYIEPPFHANLGCWNVRFGKCVYANFHLTMVDDGIITVGDYTLIGPNVTIATACHPIHPDLRARGLQYNLPVHIGKNVWIGAGSTILPGVTIGDNTVIGAGSLVTNDIPANSVAVGSPCRVMR